MIHQQGELDKEWNTVRLDPGAYLRPPSLSPSLNLIECKPNHCITFLHPAYPDYYNLLLNLSAFDTLDAGHRGLHSGTAFFSLCDCSWKFVEKRPDRVMMSIRLLQKNSIARSPIASR